MNTIEEFEEALNNLKMAHQASNPNKLKNSISNSGLVNLSNFI